LAHCLARRLALPYTFMSATIKHPFSLSQRKSSLTRDELLIEYMLAESLHRTGKCLAKVLDLCAERTFLCLECKSMYLHSIK
jgi:hypothetical protein